jgi:hypothetical protein
VTNHRSHHQHRSYISRVNYSQGVIFWTTDVNGPQKRARGVNEYTA